MRTYFVSALPVSGPGLIAREIEAPTLIEAVLEVASMGAERWGEAFRITSVVEQPDLERMTQITRGEFGT